MKVIDLIKMKHNKEKMPYHIVINRMNYIYDDDYNSYIDENMKRMTIDFTDNVLNMPVELIEEQQDIDGQELKERIKNLKERIEKLEKNIDRFEYIAKRVEAMDASKGIFRYC